MGRAGVWRAGLAAAALLAWAPGVGRAADGPDAAMAARYGLVSAPLHYAGVLAGGEVQRPDLWGSTPGVPASPGPQRLLRVGLYPADAEGRVRGSAVLLDERGAVLAAGPVEGTQHDQSCRLRLSLGAETVMLDGSCSLSQLSGTLTRRDVRKGVNLARLLLWKAGERSLGEAWLAAE